MIFYDSEPNAQTITGMTIVENTPVTKQLSGVYYYDSGSTWDVAISDMDYLPSNTAPTNLVSLTLSEYGISNTNLTYTDLTGFSWNHDATNASYSDTLTTSVANFCTISNIANIEAQVSDWVAGASASSANASICVNTYADDSTRIFENFTSESRRRTSVWGVWDSTQDLNAYDDNSGLCVVCSRISYPSIDFTSYSPLAASQPDYSGSAGTRTYFTNFYHIGTSHSNGMFQFGDFNITETDITNTDFVLEISKDAIFWYNCGVLYSGGALGGGDGCRINKDIHSLAIDNRIEFTLGTGGFTDGTTGLPADGFWGLYIRISWSNAISAKYLGSIEITNWV